MQSDCVFVQVCANCSQHIWCTHHDQFVYLDYFQKSTSHSLVKLIIESQLEGIKVQINVIPDGFIQKAQENKILEKSTGKEFKYPQIGSFQVYYKTILVFSKHQTQQWPDLGQLVQYIRLITEEYNEDQYLDKFNSYKLMKDQYEFNQQPIPYSYDYLRNHSQIPGSLIGVRYKNKRRMRCSKKKMNKEFSSYKSVEGLPKVKKLSLGNKKYVIVKQGHQNRNNKVDMIYFKQVNEMRSKGNNLKQIYPSNKHLNNQFQSKTFYGKNPYSPETLHKIKTPENQLYIQKKSSNEKKSLKELPKLNKKKVKQEDLGQWDSEFNKLENKLDSFQKKMKQIKIRKNELERRNFNSQDVKHNMNSDPVEKKKKINRINNGKLKNKMIKKQKFPDKEISSEEYKYSLSDNKNLNSLLSDDNQSSLMLKDKNSNSDQSFYKSKKKMQGHHKKLNGVQFYDKGLKDYYQQFIIRRRIKSKQNRKFNSVQKINLENQTFGFSTKNQADNYKRLPPHISFLKPKFIQPNKKISNNLYQIIEQNENSKILKGSKKLQTEDKEIRDYILSEKKKDRAKEINSDFSKTIKSNRTKIKRNNNGSGIAFYPDGSKKNRNGKGNQTIMKPDGQKIPLNNQTKQKQRRGKLQKEDICNIHNQEESRKEFEKKDNSKQKKKNKDNKDNYNNGKNNQINKNSKEAKNIKDNNNNNNKDSNDSKKFNLQQDFQKEKYPYKSQQLSKDKMKITESEQLDSNKKSNRTKQNNKKQSNNPLGINQSTNRQQKQGDKSFDKRQSTNINKDNLQGSDEKNKQTDKQKTKDQNQKQTNYKKGQQLKQLKQNKQKDNQQQKDKQTDHKKNQLNQQNNKNISQIDKNQQHSQQQQLEKNNQQAKQYQNEKMKNNQMNKTQNQKINNQKQNGNGMMDNQQVQNKQNENKDIMYIHKEQKEIKDQKEVQKKQNGNYDNHYKEEQKDQQKVQYNSNQMKNNQQKVQQKVQNNQNEKKENQYGHQEKVQNNSNETKINEQKIQNNFNETKDNHQQVHNSQIEMKLNEQKIQNNQNEKRKNQQSMNKQNKKKQNKKIHNKQKDQNKMQVKNNQKKNNQNKLLFNQQQQNSKRLKQQQQQLESIQENSVYINNIWKSSVWQYNKSNKYKSTKKVVRAPIVRNLYYEDDRLEYYPYMIQKVGNQNFRDEDFKYGQKEMQKLYKNPVLFDKQLDIKNIQIGSSRLVNLYNTIKLLIAKNSLLIKRLFENEGLSKNGMYGLWLCKQGNWVSVVIDQYVQVNKQTNKPLKMHSLSNQLQLEQQLWPTLLQKAIAKTLGSYEKACYLKLNDFIKLLLGSPTIEFRIKEQLDHNNKMWKFINGNVNDVLIVAEHINFSNINSEKLKANKLCYIKRMQFNIQTEDYKGIMLYCEDEYGQTYWINAKKFCQNFNFVYSIDLKHNYYQTNITEILPIQKCYIFQLQCLQPHYGFISINQIIFENSIEMGGQDNIVFQQNIDLNRLQVYSHTKLSLYKQTQQKYFKKIGQMLDKRKQAFFQCNFKVGKYLLFLKFDQKQKQVRKRSDQLMSTIIGIPFNLSYFGQEKLSIKLVEHVNRNNLRNNKNMYVGMNLSSLNKSVINKEIINEQRDLRKQYQQKFQGSKAKKAETYKIKRRKQKQFSVNSRISMSPVSVIFNRKRLLQQ